VFEFGAHGPELLLVSIQLTSRCFGAVQVLQSFAQHLQGAFQLAAAAAQSLLGCLAAESVLLQLPQLLVAALQAVAEFAAALAQALLLTAQLSRIEGGNLAVTQGHGQLLAPGLDLLQPLLKPRPGDRLGGLTQVVELALQSSALPLDRFRLIAAVQLELLLQLLELLATLPLLLEGPR
jgi:hypothetical protein